MQLIKKHTSRATYYDEEHQQYIKTFVKPKWYSKKGIRILLGLFKTPGKHVVDLTQKLNNIGIQTPKIIKADDYSFSMSEMHLESLTSYRSKHGDYAFKKELETIIVKMLHAGIIHGDPNPDNFLCHGTELALIDIDALSDSPLKFLPKPRMLFFLWNYNNKDYDFTKNIARQWPQRTLLQKGMDYIYTMRVTFLMYANKGNKLEQEFRKQMKGFL